MPVTEDVNVAREPTHSDAGPLAETLVGAASTVRAAPDEVTEPHVLPALTVYVPASPAVAEAIA